MSIQNILFNLSREEYVRDDFGAPWNLAILLDILKADADKERNDYPRFACRFIRREVIGKLREGKVRDAWDPQVAEREQFLNFSNPLAGMPNGVITHIRVGHGATVFKKCGKRDTVRQNVDG